MKLSPNKGTQSWCEEGPTQIRGKCEGSGHLYRCDKDSEEWDHSDQLKLRYRQGA
jgi:hypothetical protein